VFVQEIKCSRADNESRKLFISIVASREHISSLTPTRGLKLGEFNESLRHEIDLQFVCHLIKLSLVGAASLASIT
jgi:hypothetical protein